MASLIGTGCERPQYSVLLLHLRGVTGSAPATPVEHELPADRGPVFSAPPSLQVLAGMHVSGG